MSYSVGYSKNNQCIFVEVTGELSLGLLQSIATDVAKLADGNGCKCIINDLRKATLTPKAFEVVNMPKTAQKSGVMVCFKRALIVGDRTEEFKFLETVFLNQGHLVKMFPTIEEGEAWLYESV